MTFYTFADTIWVSIPLSSLSKQNAPAPKSAGAFADCQKAVSFRASAHTGVGIPWIFKLLGQKTSHFSSI